MPPWPASDPWQRQKRWFRGREGSEIGSSVAGEPGWGAAASTSSSYHGLEKTIINCTICHCNCWLEKSVMGKHKYKCDLEIGIPT